ncbi:MAG: periplasmic heavy metal sensor [Deltaproteobacteria bacterium]|nr:periplasmic heavy metal sensor [Deltaproteobacteria bacterium]
MRTKTVSALVVTLAGPLVTRALTRALIGALVGALAGACKDKDPAPTAAPSASTSSVTPQTSAPAASASAAASADPDADGGAAGRGRHERGPHARGISAMFFRTAKDLPNLEEAQKTKIEAAEKSSHDSSDSREAIKSAGKELHTELLAAIKAGKIDAAKLEPKYAAIEKAMKAQHEKEAEGLVALHATLTPPQRKALVEEAKKKQAVLDERMAKREERMKVDREARAKKRVERLTEDLDLDAEQQKKVGALTPPDAGGPDRAEMKKRTDALLAAFEKDTFDAKKVDVFDAKKARAPMEQEAKLVTQLLPVLKPEQREKLAAKMEKGPSPHGRRGGFDRGRSAADDDDD